MAGEVMNRNRTSPAGSRVADHWSWWGRSAPSSIVYSIHHSHRCDPTLIEILRKPIPERYL